jgi:hypothetical protein
MRPRARREQVATTEVGGDLVLYDNARKMAHCLDPATAHVWRACDGLKTVDEIAAGLRAELVPDADVGTVELALEELRGAGLLDEPEVRAAGVSRRQALKRIGLAGAAAAAVPSVVSIVLPGPAGAQSFACADPGGLCGTSHLLGTITCCDGKACVPDPNFPGPDIVGTCP